MSSKGWIGVDLDGTLAHYDNWKGVNHIGAPIPRMVERVQQWLSEGRVVKIFTARVYGHDQHSLPEVCAPIFAWCEEHLGTKLDITCVKDFHMIALYDDRAVQVRTNTGQLILDPDAAEQGTA